MRRSASAQLIRPDECEVAAGDGAKSIVGFTFPRTYGFYHFSVGVPLDISDIDQGSWGLLICSD